MAPSNTVPVRPPTVRPHAWMVCPGFGVGSEVWMYRQAIRIGQFDLSVKTGVYKNQSQFPVEGFDIQTIEGSRRLARTTAIRYAQQNWLANRNRLVPGFAKSTAETRWWVSQIQRRRPDVLLAHYGTTAVDMAPLARHFGVPIVAHFNGSDASKSLRRIRYCRQIIESLDVIKRLVVVSNEMRDQLCRIGVPGDQIVKIPYGVPSVNPPDRAGKIRPCEFIAVGRLVAKKRPDITIRAFAAAIEQLRIDGWSSPRLPRLTVIGKGSLHRRCKNLVTRLNIGSQVEMTGYLAAAETQQRLAAADVFVQHSVTARNGDSEGWPVSIAEAASWGLPVISTRHASIGEQVIDGKTGLLTDPLDWQTMAQHIYHLAIDADPRHQFGQAAAEHMAAINVDDQVDQLQGVLHAAMSAQASAKELIALHRFASYYHRESVQAA